MSQFPSNPQFGTLSGNFLGGVLGKPATSAGSFGEKLNQADADSSNTTSAAQALVRCEKYHYSNFTENNSDPLFPHPQEKQKFQLRAARFANSAPPHLAQTAGKVDDSVNDQGNTAEQENGQDDGEKEENEEGEG
jgi:hypothetical protein